MRWIPLLLVAFYGGSSLAKDIFCSGDVQTPCRAGLCYDSIRLEDGRITSGCATARDCTQTGCKLTTDKFLCCCAGSTCNGKSAGLLRSRLLQYQERKPTPQIMKSDKNGRLNPRDVIPPLPESQPIVQSPTIPQKDEKAPSEPVKNEQPAAAKDQNIEMKDSVTLSLLDTTTTRAKVASTEVETFVRTEKGNPEPISEKKKLGPPVQKPNHAVPVEILAASKATSAPTMNTTAEKVFDTQKGLVRVETANKYKTTTPSSTISTPEKLSEEIKQPESTVNQSPKVAAVVMKQQETTTHVSVQQTTESEMHLSHPQVKPQSNTKDLNESISERLETSTTKPESSTAEVKLPTTPEMTTTLGPEMHEIAAGGPHEYKVTASPISEEKTSSSLEDLTQTSIDEKDSEEYNSDAEHVFFTAPGSHASNTPTETSEVHEVADESSPTNPLLEKVDPAREATTQIAQKQSPVRNQGSPNDNSEEESLENEDDDTDTSEYVTGVRTDTAAEKLAQHVSGEDIVEKNLLVADAATVDSNNVKNSHAMENGRNLSADDSEEDDSGDPLPPAPRNPASPAAVEESSISVWWIAAALVVVGLAGVVFLFTKKAKKPVCSPREQELILVDPLLKEKNEKIVNETPSVA